MKVKTQSILTEIIKSRVWDFGIHTAWDIG